jgi:single-strand DNA-binding protein
MPTRKQESKKSKKEASTAEREESVSELPASVTTIGNLTRDPELRLGKEKGTPFLSLGLAVNEPKVPGDWAGEQRTDFYDVTCFGSLAENVAECLTKGVRVVVTGRPEVEHFAADDGTQQVRKRILANGIGPDLRWAIVDIRRAQKARSASTPVAVDESAF